MWLMRRVIAAIALGCLVAAVAGVAGAQESVAGANEAFTFAVIGSCQPPPGSAYSPVLATLAADIGQQQPAFVLGTGDYIAGSTDEATLRQQYGAFFQAIQPFQRLRSVPVAFAPGRAEVGRSSRNLAIFEEYFGGSNYSFDYQGCHFVVLNTEVPNQECRIAGKQWEWLYNDLLHALDARFIFVVMHRPLFPVDGEVDNCLDHYPKYRDALHWLFVTRRVACVFAGCERLYRPRRLDGVDYFITGGGGSVPLAAEPDKGGFHHYLIVRVGEGYQVTVRRLNYVPQ